MSPTRTPIDGRITFLIRLGTAVARTVGRLFARVHLEGAVEAVPRAGAVIIVANHASNADGLLLGGWLTPLLGRRIQWLGKREIVDFPILGRLARAGGIHGLDRGAADVDAFRTAQRILEAGHPLVVFPEGTRSPTGQLAPARDGVAILALRTGAPILPIGLEGTHRAWPKGRAPRFGQWVVIRIGEPFTLGDGAAAGTPTDRRAAKSAATERIMRAIAALLPPDQRGAYG